MRRLLRILLTVATAASLLLFVAAVALSVRGWRVGDSLMVAHTRAGGPPWRRVLVQGWHSGGGVRVVVQVSRTTVAPRPSGVPYPPNWTPLGMPGWHVSHDEYSREPYPYDAFITEGFTWRGFEWSAAGRSAAGASEWSRSLTAPAWFALLALAALPAWRAAAAVVRRRRRRRAARDGPRCVACGYDLRATPGRCPECGTTPIAEQVK